MECINEWNKIKTIINITCENEKDTKRQFNYCDILIDLKINKGVSVLTITKLKSRNEQNMVLIMNNLPNVDRLILFTNSYIDYLNNNLTNLPYTLNKINFIFTK